MLAEFRREPSAANTREGLLWRTDVEAIRLLRIHHAAVIASDYRTSKKFYTEILGLRGVAENYRAERSSHKLDLALPDGTRPALFSLPDPPAGHNTAPWIVGPPHTVRSTGPHNVEP